MPVGLVWNGMKSRPRWDGTGKTRVENRDGPFGIQILRLNTPRFTQTLMHHIRSYNHEVGRNRECKREATTPRNRLQMS